jgi:hypothetical protein
VRERLQTLKKSPLAAACGENEPFVQWERWLKEHPVLELSEEVDLFEQLILCNSPSENEADVPIRGCQFAQRACFKDFELGRAEGGAQPEACSRYQLLLIENGTRMGFITLKAIGLQDLAMTQGAELSGQRLRALLQKQSILDDRGIGLHLFDVEVKTSYESVSADSRGLGESMNTLQSLSKRKGCLAQPKVTVRVVEVRQLMAQVAALASQFSADIQAHELGRTIKYCLNVVPGKSSEWIAQFFLREADKEVMPFALAQYGSDGKAIADSQRLAGFNQKAKAIECKHVVFLDDGHYSGYQLVNYLTELITEIRSHKSQCRVIWIIAPFISGRCQKRIAALLDRSTSYYRYFPTIHLRILTMTQSVATRAGRDTRPQSFLTCILQNPKQESSGKDAEPAKIAGCDPLTVCSLQPGLVDLSHEWAKQGTHEDASLRAELAELDDVIDLEGVRSIPQWKDIDWTSWELWEPWELGEKIRSQVSVVSPYKRHEWGVKYKRADGADLRVEYEAGRSLHGCCDIVSRQRFHFLMESGSIFFVRWNQEIVFKPVIFGDASKLAKNHPVLARAVQKMKECPPQSLQGDDFWMWFEWVPEKKLLAKEHGFVLNPQTGEVVREKEAVKRAKSVGQIELTVAVHVQSLRTPEFRDLLPSFGFVLVFLESG